MRRLSIVLAIPLIAIVAAIGIPAATTSEAPDKPPMPRRVRRRPDIVLVTIDALRADHLSGYGYRRLTSPNIDEFADGAVRFTNAITQAPYTKAAVASLMTGLYPSAHRTVTATVPFAETMTGHPTTAPATTDVLSPRLRTLATRLRAAGYTTIGLTANPFLIAPFGFGQGFDTFDFFPGGDFAGADRVVERAIDHVRHAGDRPLFLWIHLMEPHATYDPPPLTRGMFPVAGRPHPLPSGMQVPSWLLAGSPRDLRPYESNYDDEIAAVDAGVARLLRGLDDVRGTDEAAIVITADHGEEFLDHGGWEHSATLYDEVVRVPLAIRVPGIAPATVDAQVQLLDLYPTLLELGGLDVPSPTQGRSLLPMLRGERPSRPAYTEVAGVQHALRTDDWKVIVFGDGRVELFNLRSDPHEQQNVAGDQPARTADMRHLADEALEESMVLARDVEHLSAPIDPAVLEQLRAVGYLGGPTASDRR
jgi:arylsulfatase A-like enzyme